MEYHEDSWPVVGLDDVSASTAPGTLRVRATHDGKVFLQRRARDGAVLAHLVLTPDEAVKMLGVTLAVLQQGVNPPSLDDVRACLQAASAQDPF